MIRFRSFITEGSLDDAKLKAAHQAWAHGVDEEEIIAKYGKRYLAAVKKQRNFKEAEELKLDQGKVKEINKALFDIVKTAKADVDLATVIEPIRTLLADYDINIPAPSKMITNKGEKRFSCAPYTNIELVVKWAKNGDEYQLKDADLQGIE